MALSGETKVFIGIGLATLAIFIGGIFFLSRNQQTSTDTEVVDVLSSCVVHGGSLGMHIHPILTIKLLGEEQKIPADIGVTPTCMRPVHTHDETGTLHLEYPRQTDVKLSEFFRVWGKTFSKEQILDQKVDENHEIKVTVNGQETTEFENLIMGDGDQIVIEYNEIENK